MSTLALMRFLQSAPDRYDRGMWWLTLGRVDEIRDAVAAAVPPLESPAVLELGCGTGALTALLIARGARVTAVDQNPEMLEIARERLAAASQHDLRIVETTAAEIDGREDGCFDTVVASLVFSEMSSSERAYVLRHGVRVLRPGGRLIVGDEVRPRRLWQLSLHALVRLPLALLTWVLVGSGSQAITDLDGELRRAGLERVVESRNWLGTLALVSGERPGSA